MLQHDDHVITTRSGAGTGAGGARRRPRRVATGLTVAAVATGALVACAGGAEGLPAHAGTHLRPGHTAAPGPAVAGGAGRGVVTTRYAGHLRFVQRWSVEVAGVIAQSSPMPAVLGGTRAVVVGARNGDLYAVGLAGGRPIRGWPVQTPGARPVDSTPSVNGSILYVGTGDAGAPWGGGYLAVNANGGWRWYRQVPLTPGGGGMIGVAASMSIGYLGGTKTVVAGSLGQFADAFATANGAVRPGFPWFSSDTEFSTPAIANLYGNGRNYVIGGAEQTGGNALGHLYRQGGHLRVLDGTGNAGTGRLDGGVACDFTPDQGVYSSPAVGRFLRGGAVGITFGTSTDFAGASDTDKVFGIDSHCRPVWSRSLDGSTQDSPALVDALGNNHLQVAEGTQAGPNAGTVYLLDGANGGVYWAHHVGGQVIGGITSADLGTGHQDLLVPTTGGLYVLDGRTGREVATLGAGAVGEQSSPLVTDDANGSIGITVAGYNSRGGEIAHFEVLASSGARADEPGAWPMFHHDTWLTGSTLPRLIP